MEKEMFGIIGAGTIGTLIAVGLEKSGLYQCAGVNTRSQVSRERFRGYISCDFLSLEELIRRCSLIFITTPDDVIARVAQTLQQNDWETVQDSFGERGDGVRTLIHCSGALPWRVMDFDRCSQDELSWRYVGVHPYRAFSSIADGLASMQGTHFGVDGSDEQAAQCGGDIVRALGGIAHSIPEDGKALYHGAAVMTSNYLVTLASMGVELLEKIGLTVEESLELVLPLMQGTLDNLKTGGLGVLTGPILRGDVEVVRCHLAYLPEEMQDVYRSLGIRTLELARRQHERAGRSCVREVEMRKLLN